MTLDSLTVPEAAAAARVHEETIRRWIKRGLLRASKTPGGREYRVTLAELRRVGAVAPEPTQAAETP